MTDIDAGAVFPGRTRWPRAVFAGVLAELCTILLIVLVVTAHGAIAGVPPGASTSDPFAERAGLALGPAGGVLFTLLFARWALRGVSRAPVAHGLVVAATAVALHLASVSATADGLRPIAVVADALKLLAGAAAGYFSTRTNT